MITFKLTNEQYELLNRLYPNDKVISILKQGKNGDTYSLKEDDYVDFILFVDDAIIEKGMINQDYLTRTGIKLQDLYDSLFLQSEEES